MKYLMEGVIDWEPEKTPDYMNRLTRSQVSVIFKTRARMIKVKGNYINGSTDLTCRACKSTTETQQHVLQECPTLHPYGKPQNNEMDPFSKDINVLKETAKNVENIINELNNNGSMGQRTIISGQTPASTQ